MSAPATRGTRILLGVRCWLGTYLQNKIDLNNTGSALLHELLHHLEAGISTDHDHWWEKGYYAADLEFGTRYQAFNSPPSGPTGN